jgi:hypothetical protein
VRAELDELHLCSHPVYLQGAVNKTTSDHFHFHFHFLSVLASI